MADIEKVKNQTRLLKHTNAMSKDELEEALTKKKECNARALQIVEGMLEIPVNKDWFLRHLKYIRQNHYEDVVEERAITKVCGYPLCSETLKDVPSHQYHVSIKSKKVYDITERKKFCSNFCYKAAKYLQDQLLTTPLWLEDTEESFNFKIMPNDSSGTIGQEIIVGQDLLKSEPNREESEFISLNQFAIDSLVKVTPESTIKNDETKNESLEKKIVAQEKPLPLVEPRSSKFKKESKHFENFASSTDSTLAVESSITGLPEQITGSIDSSSRDVIEMNINKSTTVNMKEFIDIRKPCPKLKDVTNRKVSLVEEKNIRKSQLSGKGGTPTGGQTSPVHHIEKCLHEWFNLETIIYLFGETKSKELIEAKGKSIKEYNDAVSKLSRDPKLHDRYEKICKRLSLMELEDVQFDERLKGVNQQLKPLPDYRDIQEDGKKMELKVNAFFHGKTVYTDNPDSCDGAAEEESEPLVPDNLMPLVDLHAQKALRRRIVIDGLKKVLPDLLRAFGFTSHDVISEVRALVNTFSLEAHNITFKPAEWTLLGLIIIKLLGVKNIHISAQLNSKQMNKHHAAIVAGFQQEADYTGRLVNALVDIDNLFKCEESF